MSGAPRPTSPRDRSQPRRRRFGFFNLFGFATDASNASTKSNSSRHSLHHDSNGGSSRNSSDNALEHSQNDSAASRAPSSECVPSKETTSHQQPLPPDVLSSDAGTTPLEQSIDAAPNISIKPSATRISAPQPINIQPHVIYHARSADSAGNSMDASLDIGDHCPSSPSVGAPSFSAMRGRAPHHPGSQIRTCPIPERLRLQLRDASAHDSTDSSSPTITASSYSAQTLTDSPRTLQGAHAPLVRRRGTTGTGGSLARRSPKNLDAVATPQATPAAHSPRAGKSVLPLARRTSSSYSSWSAATPTSTYGTADSVPAATAQNDYGMLPDWESAGKQQQQHSSSSTKGRSRSRRYSVFDLAFANQRPAPWPSSTQNPPMLGSGGVGAARRRSSDKSAAESVGSAELSSIPSGGRRSGASSVVPHALDIARSRRDSRVQVRGPSTDPTASHVYPRSASDYLSFQESDMFSSHRHHHYRRHRHSREQSQGSVATFSTHSMPANGQGHDIDNESGSGGRASRRRQHHRPFSTGFHDSSSGQSTPNHLLFARLRHKPSGSVKSVNVAELCHSPELMPRTPEGREYKGGTPQHMSASHQLGRSRRGIRTNNVRQNDDEDGYSGDVEADGGNEVLYLRFSTSVPDILVMPMVSHMGGHWRTIKRPDFSYERLLATSRSTKVRRWRQHQPASSIADSSGLAATPRDSRITPLVDSSPLSQFGVVSRRATVGTTGGLSREVSQTPTAQLPMSYPRADTPVRRKPSVSPRYAAAPDPTDAVTWTDWTDFIKSPSHAPAAQRAITMWHNISRNVSREHRSRQNSLKARRDSLGGYLSTSNLPRPSTILSASSIQSSVGAMDIGTLPPSGGCVTAMLNPYLVEPTYLQRGVSESGRQASPKSAFSSIYQIPSFSNLDSTQSPSMTPADTDSARWSARAQGSHLSKVKENAAAGAFGDAILGPVTAAAPHRRLSIIKGQELGRSWGNTAGVGTSPPRLEKAGERASLGNDSGSRGSPGSGDKSPWIIAHLDDPEEGVEMLQSFQSRIQLRLSKAKVESEQELLEIIQDLSEFVEEGLSYVNEDGATYSPYNDDSAASEDYCSDASYVSDQDDGYSPDLDVSALPLPTEQGRAVLATNHRQSRGMGDRLTRANVANPDGTVTAAARELQCLNKRLHDVLNLHNDSKDGHADAARPTSQPSGLQLQLEPSPPLTVNAPVGVSAISSTRHSPMQRLIRSPSIRRLAFLRALSGERAIVSEPASIDGDSTKQAEPDTVGGRSRIRHSVELPSALPLFSGPRQKLSEASLQQHLGFASDPALHETHSDNVPEIVVRRDSGLHDEVHARTSQSTPRIAHDPLLASWSDLQLGARGRSVSPQSEIPFPSLHTRIPARSVSSPRQLEVAASETSSISGGGGHYSPGVRSQSRSSMYSAGSRTSLLASPLIAEDEFKPTPFLQAIIDLVTIIGHVVSLSASDMLRPLSGPLLDEALNHLALLSDDGGSAEDVRLHAMSLMPTAYVVERLNELGHLWEQPPQAVDEDEDMADQPWPCRGLFFRALLAISSLNRIVMWYAAVRTTYSEEIVAEVDRRVSDLERDMTEPGGTGASFPSVNPAGYGAVGASPFSGDGANTMGSLTGKSSATSLSTAGLSSQLAGDSAVAVNVGYTGGSAQPAWHSFQAQPQTSKWQGDNLFSQSTAAVDKGLNMLVEITLDGRIRYISPTCQRLLGTKPEALINQPASTIFTADSILVCRSAVEQLLADSTRTVEINITVHSPDLSRAAMVEAKGMLIYCRARNEPSHVMWVLRYAVASPPQHQPAPEESVVGSELAERLASALPRPVTEHGEDIAPSALSLGLVGGEDMEFESARELVAVSGGELPDVIEEDEAAAMSLSPVEYITCRICDRAIPATYFEEHNWLCAQSHRAAMDVEQLNERLSDVKAEIQAWYPGCDFEELEDMVHGGTDVETLQEHAQQRASEVGHPAWQDLINEASSSVKSMTKVCLMALALDEYDASPKCTHPAALGALGVQVDSSELDFQRSDNWISVARYTVPVLDYHDPALQSLGESLIRTIAAKLTAIDNLQYAIVESSVACTNWVLPKDSSMVPDAFLSQERLRRSISAIDIPSSNVEQGVSELHYNASTKGIDEARSRSAHTSDPQCTDGIESASQQGLPWQYDQYDGSADASHSRADVGTSPRLGGPAAINMASRRTSSQVNIDIPTIRKTSSASLSVSQMSPLRISTTNLYPTTGTTPNRPNIIGSSAFLATPTVPSIHDFVVLKPISKGAYGSVYLAKKRTTGEYYAIKILKKADMISKNQISNVKAERAIMMAQTGSPFVVRLLYTFQSRTSLYLVMEYLNGGDCAALLKAIGTLSEDWARNYLAEVVLGIEDLHARNVVHRDLKPDNLLIDSEGHLKLTDFGLSKLGFLGRRVDQHALSHPINANDSALLSGTSPGAVTSNSRVWQPYVSGSAESARGVSTDHLSTLDDGSSQPMTPMQAAVVIPSISTPPPMKSDRFNSQHSPQTRPDSVQGKRVSALKGSPTLPNGLGSDGSSNAVAGSSTSLSSSASTSSEAYGNTPAPRHQKHALGTPDYIAPESILGLESGKSVDWWALGIICYEFLFGIPPFHDETPEKVFSNILSADLDFYDELREQLKRENEEKRAQHEQKRALRHQASGSPDEDGDSDDEHEDGDGCDDTGVADISPDARDFITRLLCRDPKKRLGYNGAAEVKAHPIFAGIDWDTLLETQPAFVPQVDDVEDTDYFDTRGATMEASDEANMQGSESDDNGNLSERQPGTSYVEAEPQQSSAIKIASGRESSVPANKATSKSHPHEPSMLQIGAGVAMHRPSTVPLRLNELPSKSRDAAYEEPAAPAPTTARTPQETSKDQECVDELPALEDGPEFGRFTFKNLHALEQANMNELVKLRRRSTLLDMSPRPYARLDSRSSLVPGLASDNLLLSNTKRHQSFLVSNSSSRNSVHMDMSSPGPESSMFSLRRMSSSDSSEHMQGLGADRLHPPLSAGAQLSRTRTISCFTPSARVGRGGFDDGESARSGIGSSSNVASGRGRSISNSRDSLSIASPGSPTVISTPGHVRALSAHAHIHRGSLLNPSAQTPTSSKSTQQQRPQLPSVADSTPANLASVPIPGKQGLPPPPPRPTRLTSSLPRPSLVKAASYELPGTVAAPPQPDYMHSRICLVADDNPVCLKIMEIILRRLHMECVIVRNGAEAIRCAMGRTVFRAIFMDTGMPIVDGDEATRMIKSTYNANKDTPIIAMVAYDGEAAGSLYDDDIVKPVTLHHVKQSLDRAS